MADIAPERLVFLDECGMALNLFRPYGWVIGGGRCLEEVPFNQRHSPLFAGCFLTARFRFRFRFRLT